jgi:hypothetical protein
MWRKLILNSGARAVSTLVGFGPLVSLPHLAPHAYWLPGKITFALRIDMQKGTGCNPTHSCRAVCKLNCACELAISLALFLCVNKNRHSLEVKKTICSAFARLWGAKSFGCWVESGIPLQLCVSDNVSKTTRVPVQIRNGRRWQTGAHRLMMDHQTITYNWITGTGGCTCQKYVQLNHYHRLYKWERAPRNVSLLLPDLWCYPKWIFRRSCSLTKTSGKLAGKVSFHFLINHTICAAGKIVQAKLPLSNLSQESASWK